MHVLVLTGSPRKGGNSDMLADAFARGALSAGHTVDVFRAGRKAISGCTSCDACRKTGVCAVRDGFAELEPLRERADALALATPLYWFGMSAQLKAAVDRLFPYTMPACPRPLKIAGSVFLICGADGEPGIFDGAIATYRLVAGYMKWRDRGILAVPGVSRKGDVARTGALERAEALGASLQVSDDSRTCAMAS